MAPAFKPNDRQRRKVELLVGSIPEEEIAKLIGIDRSTLRRHFRDELACGRARILSKCMEQLEKAASRGNVSAIKVATVVWALRSRRFRPINMGCAIAHASWAAFMKLSFASAMEFTVVYAVIIVKLANTLKLPT